VKYDVLQVPRGPVVSGEAAIAMARGVKKTLHSSVGLALTGVAGPAEQEGQPVGTLWVGVCLADGSEYSQHFRLATARDQMRQMSVITALNYLRLLYL
jgi:nicotinamide-nucleotide amidase